MIASGIERFDLETIAASPWRNGAGKTREIAVHPEAAGLADFGWRISVADVAGDAPFSGFPGIDRCIVLLSGAGMRLVGPEGELLLDAPLAPLHFSGDLALRAELIDGPCRDFNVMTRRGTWLSEITRHDGEVRIAGDAPGLLLCAIGRWHLDIGSNPLLVSMQGVFWRAPIDAFTARPSDQGTLLQVRLCQHPGR